MSQAYSISRKVAIALIDHAARVLSVRGSTWAAAMRSELHHIDEDVDALRWAAGCVFASYIERFRNCRRSQHNSPAIPEAVKGVSPQDLHRGAGIYFESILQDTR